MKKTLSFILALVLLTGLMPIHTFASASTQGTESNAESKTLNILMIGNSFSWDAADFWYDLKTSMTYDAMKAMLAEPYDVHLAVMYQGSATLGYHATCAANNTGTYTFQEIGPETNYTWQPSDGKNANNKILPHLQERDWDIIVIQSYQHEADGTEPRSTYTGGSAQFVEPSASIGFLLDYFAQNEPGAEVYYYMPWSSVKFYGAEGTAAGYEAIGAYTEAKIPHMTGTNSGKTFSGIIPVGTAIENARTTYLHSLRYSAGVGDTFLLKDPQIGLLYDTQHLSFGVGRYIAGLTVAQTLIPQEMRKENIVWPSVKESPSVGILPEEYSVIARQAVENALQNPYKITPISGYDADPAHRICNAIEAADFTGADLTDEASVRRHLETKIQSLLASWGNTNFTLDIQDYTLENGTLWNLDAEVTLRVGYTTGTTEITVTEGTNHRFGQWTRVSVPSAEAPGLEQRTCAKCGYVQSVEVEGSWQKYDLADHLQALPDSFCSRTNLWELLEPETVMINHEGKWVVASALVHSVTIPVNPGDRVFANSFVEKGIQVSFIGDYGIIKTYFSSDTKLAYQQNGCLIAPEGTIAVNVPVWDYRVDNELYILNAEHAYTSKVTAPTCAEQGFTTHTCACGDSYVDSYAEATGEHSYKNGVCTVCGTTAAGIVITSQPDDVQVSRYNRFSVSVEAEGEGLTYQWYYKDPGMENFFPSVNKTSSYSYAMAAHMAGRQVYCVITDSNGNQVTTDTATIRLPDNALKLTEQPKNAAAAPGETATVSVTVTGDGLIYRWYKRTGTSGIFKSTDCTAATYRHTLRSQGDIVQVYCIVTDAYGNEVRSNIVTISAKG